FSIGRRVTSNPTAIVCFERISALTAGGHTHSPTHPELESTSPQFEVGFGASECCAAHGRGILPSGRHQQARTATVEACRGPIDQSLIEGWRASREGKDTLKRMTGGRK